MVTPLLLLSALLPAQAAVQRAQDEPPHEATGRSYLADIDLALRYTAQANRPQAQLDYDVLCLSGPSGGPCVDTVVWQRDTLLRPQGANDFPSLVVALSLEKELSEHTYLRLLFDSGELRQASTLEAPLDDTVAIASDGASLGDAASSASFVRELLLGFSAGPLHGKLGRFRFDLAEGLVFTDYATGAALDLALGRVALELSTLAIGRTLDELRPPSPLATLKLGYDLSLFERVSLFAALFIDRSGMLNDILSSALAEQALLRPVVDQEMLTRLLLTERASAGRLLYLGGEGNWLPLDGLSLRGAAVASLGTLSIEGPVETFEFALHSWAGAFNASYGLTPRLGVGAMGFALSGGRARLPFTATGLDLSQPIPYNAFIGIAPYWTWTGIFFSGGVSQGIYPGRATAAGFNGHGVYGGGPTLAWSGDAVNLEVRAALLRAFVSMLPDRPTFGYGIETDLLASWRLSDRIELTAELDLLQPGSFFPERTVAYRAIGQLNLRWGN